MRCRGPNADSVGPNRLGDILNAMAAKRAVVEGELILNLLVDSVRNAHSTRLGECLEPRGDINAIAEDVLTIYYHIAEIDADPQLETALACDKLVECPRGALHLNGAVHRVDDACEICQQTITGAADDAPAMCRDQRVNCSTEGA
jgi:hypothetical protein